MVVGARTLVEEAALHRMVCQNLLGVDQTALWYVLDQWVALVPAVIAVLGEEEEQGLLVEMMQRYFPDETV